MSLILFRILLVALFCKNGLGNSRINQGRQISIEDAPYMARIIIQQSANFAYGCDGSILSDSYILTAGHCVTAESNINVPNPPLHGANNFSILIGTFNTYNLDGKGEVFLVSKVFFREYSSKNDLGMLKLSSKIMLDGIRKMAVTLPTDMYYYPKSHTNAYVDGWGKNPQNSANLLRTDIYTLSAEECNAGGDRPYQICTLGQNGAGPCQGDSGGPMLRADDGVQIGVVSFVPLNCENPRGSPSIFTSVARNLNWIRRIMNGTGENHQIERTTSRPVKVPESNEATTTPTTTTTRRPLSLFGFPLGGLFPNFFNQS